MQLLMTITQFMFCHLLFKLHSRFCCEKNTIVSRHSDHAIHLKVMDLMTHQFHFSQCKRFEDDGHVLIEPVLLWIIGMPTCLLRFIVNICPW